MKVWTDGQSEVKLTQDEVDFSILVESPEIEFPEYNELIESMFSFELVEYQQNCISSLDFNEIFNGQNFLDTPDTPSCVT